MLIDTHSHLFDERFAKDLPAVLRRAADAGEIDLEVVPGLSFADLAWARLGVDPMATGARVIDGRDLERAAGLVLETRGDAGCAALWSRPRLFRVRPPTSTASP